jgi:hypothetical protein
MRCRQEQICHTGPHQDKPSVAEGSIYSGSRCRTANRYSPPLPGLEELLHQNGYDHLPRLSRPRRVIKTDGDLTITCLLSQLGQGRCADRLSNSFPYSLFRSCRAGGLGISPINVPPAPRYQSSCPSSLPGLSYCSPLSSFTIEIVLD